MESCPSCDTYENAGEAAQKRMKEIYGRLDQVKSG